MVCSATPWVSPLAAPRSNFVCARILAQKHTYILQGPAVSGGPTRPQTNAMHMLLQTAPVPSHGMQIFNMDHARGLRVVGWSWLTSSNAPLSLTRSLRRTRQPPRRCQGHAIILTARHTGAVILTAQHLPGSCPPNWSEGSARMTSPPAPPRRPKESCRCCMSAYSSAVSPGVLTQSAAAGLGVETKVLALVHEGAFPRELSLS